MDSDLLTGVHEFSSWLSLNIRILVRYGGLLSADERQVYASRSTQSAFNHIENSGDNYLCQHGPGWVKPVLGAHLTQTSASQAEAVDRIAVRVSPQIHANVGLGPFIAVMLCLPPLFSFDRSEAQSTAEIMAGMYEAIAGALQRAGQVLLLRAMQQFAAFIVCARYWHRKHGGTAGDFYGTMSPGLMCADFHGSMPDLECLWLQARAAADWALVFSDAYWNWRPALQLLLSEMAWGVSAPVGGRMTLPPSGCLYWETLEENPSFQRVWLRCAERDCKARFVSQYYVDHNNAFAEVEAARWFKPTTKTWNQGARCPLHRW